MLALTWTLRVFRLERQDAKEPMQMSHPHGAVGGACAVCVPFPDPGE